MARTTKPKKQQKWAMPEWMEPYRSLFCNTGGNSVEELMNNNTATVVENAGLALVCVAVKSQAILLARLKNAGQLR